MVEQGTFDPWVAGSIPAGALVQLCVFSLSVAQLEEHSAVVRGVRGSIPRGEIPVSRAGSEIRADSPLLRWMGPFFSIDRTQQFICLDLSSPGIAFAGSNPAVTAKCGVSKWSKEGYTQMRSAKGGPTNGL